MTSRLAQSSIAVLLTFCSLCPVILCLQEVRIIGLFNEHDNEAELAFMYAVDMVNSHQIILPRTRLMAQREKIPAGDSFLTSKKVCHLLKTGVAAIFGPQSRVPSAHVQSMCSTLEMPHVEFTWAPKPRRSDFSVNVYPTAATVSNAYAALIKQLRWKSFTIIYENNDGLTRLQYILQQFSSSKDNIKVRQLDQFTDDYRPMLKSIKKAGKGNKQFIVDCSLDKVVSFLRQAQEIQMLTPYHSYFITHLDLHTLNLDEFKYSGANITSYRLVDPTQFSSVHGHMMHRRRIPVIQKDKLYTETALLYDAVRLFARAFHRLAEMHDVNMIPLDCKERNKWGYGKSLVRLMKETYLHQGLTGTVKFDKDGFRTSIHLDIMELSRGGMEKIGHFTTEAGVNFTRSYGKIMKEQQEIIKNQTLIVTTIMNQPYALKKENFEQLSGNDRFEGYGADLVNAIANIAEFKYIIKEVDDKQYGKIDKATGIWNGMIGELINGKADLAIADLTVNFERQQVVDFSMPFMNLGIGILYIKSPKESPDLFSFFYPLSPDVWIYMATAYLGVSVLLFVLARVTPCEWDNPYPCIEDPDELENQFTLVNSLWFTIGSLMQQGSDIAPKAISTRMVAGIWWFFTLIFISSYTANLAAFLTVSRMSSPIKNADDLAKQTKIKYGSVKSGSTYAFFRDAKIEPYARMYSTMQSTKPSVFTDNNRMGIERVIKNKGAYAFLMETTSLEYAMQSHCQLAQIGGKLDNKGYGIALPPGSPFTSAVSLAILKLQQDGVLHKLKTKWWQSGKCDRGAESSSSASELGLENVGGVFVVLMGGTGIAILISICEFVWKSRKLAAAEHESLISEIGKELRFALRCNESTKPVNKKEPEPEAAPGFLPKNVISYGKLDQYGYSGKNNLQ